MLNGEFEIRFDGQTYIAKNLIVDEGLNAMINAINTIGIVADHYIGVISTVGWSAISASDTMASHSGWTEQTTGLAGVNRLAWGGTITNTIIENTTFKDITTTASVDFQGLFLSSGSIRGGTGGHLWSAFELVGAPVTVGSGLSLQIKYRVTGS